MTYATFRRAWEYAPKRNQVALRRAVRSLRQGESVRSVRPEATFGPNAHGFGAVLVVAAIFLPLAIQDQRSRLPRKPAAAKRNFGSDVHFRLSSFEEERG
ncbi:hypothetical protein [Novosphingobium lindaniclasticum]|jgi:hypothetical protein|uniref:hypothetical protein n=1 Tax=Novosphingobium lindaniclasticum TaxID=1329895 RepID=UPI002409274D|nr:hypothetical protein [Novosphingobium lindaniclasticum]